jgi:hypothetical protein
MFERNEFSKGGSFGAEDGFLVGIMRMMNKGAVFPQSQATDEPKVGYQTRGGWGKTSTTLSDKEVTEFHYYNYRSKLPIFITGDTEKWASNIVLVNGIRISIGDAPFILFLRLVVELFKNKKGMLSKTKLINAGYIKADGEYQAINRLRQAFSAALDSLSPYEFIESCERRAIRLSTHPAFISYDKERLLHHRNEKVRRLAERLP